MRAINQKRKSENTINIDDSYFENDSKQGTPNINSQRKLQVSGQSALNQVNQKVSNALKTNTHNGAFIGVAGSFKHSQNSKSIQQSG